MSDATAALPCPFCGHKFVSVVETSSFRWRAAMCEECASQGSYDPFTMWRGSGEPDGGVYTDRLFQWDHKKHDALCMKHFGDRGQYWDRRAADKIQSFLRDYLDAPELVLCEVQEHCNQATGYPCWYFAYRKTPNDTGNGPRQAQLAEGPR